MTYLERYNQIARGSGESFWLKAAIAQLAQRDPVDAVSDAEKLLELQQLKLKEALQEGGQ